jgi:hypothetical protein
MRDEGWVLRKRNGTGNGACPTKVFTRVEALKTRLTIEGKDRQECLSYFARVKGRGIAPTAPPFALIARR